MKLGLFAFTWAVSGTKSIDGRILEIKGSEREKGPRFESQVEVIFLVSFHCDAIARCSIFVLPLLSVAFFRPLDPSIHPNYLPIRFYRSRLRKGNASPLTWSPFLFTVPPAKPIIYDAKRRDMSKLLEAYPEGADLFLVCEVHGGKRRV